MVSLTGQKEAPWSDTITFRGDSITYRFVAQRDGEAGTDNSLVTGDEQADDWGFRFTVSYRTHSENGALTAVEASVVWWQHVALCFGRTFDNLAPCGRTLTTVLLCVSLFTVSVLLLACIRSMSSYGTYIGDFRMPTEFFCCGCALTGCCRRACVGVRAYRGSVWCLSDGRGTWPRSKD